MKNQKDERIIPNQIIKNYFRKGVKAKGVKRVFASLVNLKEQQVLKEIKKSLAEKKIVKKNFVQKLTLGSRGSKFKKVFYPKKRTIKKISMLRKKRVVRKKFMTSLSFSKYNNNQFFNKKLNYDTIMSSGIIKKQSKFLKHFRILKEQSSFSSWLFKQALSNCRWRVFLRNRWVAGKRMKVPFFSSLIRDTRYACKNFVKTITDTTETPFLSGLIRELYLSLNLKSNTVKKRIVAYRVLYATSLYTSGGYKIIKRRKKINRY